MTHPTLTHAELVKLRPCSDRLEAITAKLGKWRKRRTEWRIT